ncbi:hypothetical protein [Sphingomonas sp. 28-62-11]|uniref:hypothetical protein n=1 Tax=Sphingomonas sp. 28-62-11 TaxID=1970432 RepID=UPI000BC832DE|nr:MAG: hypothetical protein B7Y49_05200 [Sphingomonas sp. 28-62-11]
MATPDFDAKALSDTEQQVLDAVRRGNPYATGWSFGFDTFTPEPDDYANEIARYDGEDHPLIDAPSVRAEFLRRLILGIEDGWPVAVQGLRLSGLRIIGELNLRDGRRLGGGALPALVLEYCHFDTTVYVDCAMFSNLDFSHSLLPSLSGELVTVEGPLGLWEVVLTGTLNPQITISWATIGGLLAADGISVRPGVTSYTINAFQMNVRGRTLFSQLGRVTGTEKIPARLSIYESNLSGKVELSRNCFESIDAGNIHAHVDFEMFKSTILMGITLTGARIDGTLVMQDMTIHGGMTAMGMRCTGDWDLTGCEIFAATDGEGTGWAIAARDAVIDGNVRMTASITRPFIAHGLIGLRRAKIGSEWILRGASCNPAPEGAIQLNGPAQTEAITAEGITIGGDLRLDTTDDGATTFIGGRMALDGASIGRNMNLSGTILKAGTDEILLSLTNAEIKNHLRVRDLVTQSTAGGIIDLSGLQVGTLNDAHGLGWGQHPYRSWRKKRRGIALRLNGFTYRRFHADDHHNGSLWKARRNWLTRQDAGHVRARVYYPQPYEQLSKIFRDEGREDDARKVFMAKRVARREAGEASPVHWVLNLLYQITFGYGVAPGRAAITLALYWLGGTYLLFWAQEAGKIRVVKDGVLNGSCVDYYAALHALQLMVPLPQITGGICGIDPSEIPLKVAEVGYALGGAIVLALAVLTFSGVTRTDSTK